jgi:DNA invertase Pin-like site-specific DNA recombinase
MTPLSQVSSTDRFLEALESLDTVTPAGRMVFTVLGAVAELEDSLIAERVRAGLRNVEAKGHKLGRPRVAVDATRLTRLRASACRGQRSPASWA